MSQIDFHSSFQPAIAPYIPPPPPPPPPEPAPVVAPIQDQSQIQVQTQPPESLDLGALPWDTAEASKAPPLHENPAFQELSEADQQTLTSFLEMASEGLEPEAAEALNKELSQLLSDGKLMAVDDFGLRTLDYLDKFNTTELTPSRSEETTKAAVARELIHALSNQSEPAQEGEAAQEVEASVSPNPADQARIAMSQNLAVSFLKAGRIASTASLR